MIVPTALAGITVLAGYAPAVDSSITSGDDKWTFLGLLITTIVAPIILYLINSRALRPPSRTEERPTATTERGTSFSVDGMPANMVEVLLSMWSKIDEMEDNQKTWADERDEFIRINEELRRHNRALAEGFDEVIDWIDAGSQPPPPSVAQHVRDLVQRAIENGNYDGLSVSE